MSPASVGLGPEGSRPPLDENNPWPGLEYFRESESQFFKGRAAEAAELYQRIRDGHVTVLYGPSGIGKSSLVEAGLFPLIRAEHGLPIRSDSTSPKTRVFRRTWLRRFTTSYTIEPLKRESRLLHLFQEKPCGNIFTAARTASGMP